MISKYKGVILCILSFMFSFVSSFLIIFGAYNQNNTLIYVSLSILLIALILMVFGIYFIYKKFKGNKNEV